MVTKRKAYTVTTKLQAVKVAENMSKEAAAMSANNSQLTVNTATNTTQGCRKQGAGGLQPP